MGLTALLIILPILVPAPAPAAETRRIAFPDILPANAIACLIPPDAASLEHDYSASFFYQLSALPEMAPFLKSFEESRRLLAGDLAGAAGVSSQFAAELLDAKIGFSLINAGIGRGGDPFYEFAAVLALRGQPDRETVFSAVKALLNRPEVVRSVLQSQGMDPNLPLKSLAQEETLSGYPPILRIGPDIRVAAIGNLILIYNGHGSEGIARLFDAASRPASSLAGNPLFQAAWRGSEASAASSFLFVNAGRLMSILDALNYTGAIRAIEALGLAGAQAIGITGAYRQNGIRHNLFLASPGGRTEGILSALLPVPPEWQGVGMEAYSRTIPTQTDFFAALRIDLPTFFREASYLADSIGAIARPGGLAGLIANGQILGVPLAQLVAPLGNEIILHPHDDTLVALFRQVNIPAFEAIVGQMERNAGETFNTLAVSGYPIRYFNRRASLQAPLAPAFFLAPSRPGGQTGTLYAATHPQALVSLIRESQGSRESLAQTADFLETSAGLSGGYSFYYYSGNRDAYRRVYNFLLPVASLWAASRRYPADTGLLPPAGIATRGMFGCAIGIRGAENGALVQIFSPVGANALPVLLIDRLVISNPLAIGYVYSWLENLSSLFPAW
ncbi:MAG: hypothetical protein LBE84_07030 [Planctomycetota bacterium]|jgi:hypothetical protein|nr:hypothetical protein [Planctomycetota bacterium]